MKCYCERTGDAAATKALDQHALKAAVPPAEGSIGIYLCPLGHVITQRYCVLLQFTGLIRLNSSSAWRHRHRFICMLLYNIPKKKSTTKGKPQNLKLIVSSIKLRYTTENITSLTQDNKAYRLRTIEKIVKSNSVYFANSNIGLPLLYREKLQNVAKKNIYADYSPIKLHRKYTYVRKYT